MGKNENIEITRILDILKSKKLVILVILVTFILIGYMYSYFYVVPEYKATSTLLLIPNSTTGGQVVTSQDLAVSTDLTVNKGLIETYRKIGENSKVLKQVINNLGLDMTEEELLSQMKISIKKETYVIEVAVTNKEPKKAMEIAQEFDKVFLQEIQEIYHLNNVGIVDEARMPEKPYNINHAKDMVIFLVMGLGVSFIGMVIFYLVDNTIKKEEEIEKYIHLKSLGSIPLSQDKTGELASRNNAKSYVTECINTIRTNILYMNSAKNAKTILITSCTPQEGKSWVSANIANAFAETDKKVILIDSDLRKGRAHKIFKVSNQEGLSNYLYSMTEDRKENIELAKKYIQETKIPNLHILTNGNVPPNPAELLESNQMKELLAILKNIYDVIVIDAPPCKLVTDSVILSTIVDSTILVANSEKTKMKDFNEVKKSIQMVGGEIIGAILNKKKLEGKTYHNGYYYYGNAEETAKQKKQEKKQISVEKVIEEARPMLENKDFTEEPKEENEKIEVAKKSVKEEKNQKDNLTDMKKFISQKIKNLQKDYEELASTVKDKSYIEILLKKAEEEKLTKEQVGEIIKQEISNLSQKSLTKEQVEDIISQEISALSKEALTKEQVENIISQEVSLLNKEAPTKEQLEKVYDQMEETRKTTSKMVNEVIKQEITKIDYTKQIEQMNEMLTNLKDSYLELSNQMKANELEKQAKAIEDVEAKLIADNHNNNYENKIKNIIDFKALKKQRNKKKVYSIEEDIAYEDLEQTATYVIPLQTRKVSGETSYEDNYQKSMY